MEEKTARYAQLIQDARNGSQEAISNLIATVETYLLFIANQELDARLRKKVAASDLVQETCLHASQRFTKFRGTSLGEFKAWLRQVLLNSLADSRRKYVKSQMRQTTREVVLEDNSRLACSQLSPTTSMIAQEESEQLTAAMQRLSHDYQLVLRLRNWELMSFEKIGIQLNRTADAAQKLWARALKNLEIELKSNDTFAKDQSTRLSVPPTHVE